MKALLQQAIEVIDALREWVEAVPKDTPLPVMPGFDGDWLIDVHEALKAELAKPEPEPAAYMLTTRNFGLGGETWDTTEYRDYPWDYDCVPLYTKGATNV